MNPHQKASPNLHNIHARASNDFLQNLISVRENYHPEAVVKGRPLVLALTLRHVVTDASILNSHRKQMVREKKRKEKLRTPAILRAVYRYYCT
jgi:hypothetical protein